MSEAVQVWGTFAVDDHLRPRPFAAELILFDHLVIPAPPSWAPDALKHWPASWKPERLKNLMDTLGEKYVTPMSWDEKKRALWERAYDGYNAEIARERMQAANAVAQDVARIVAAPQDTPAKWVTREVIANIIEAGDQALFEHVRALGLGANTRIEPMVAYGSFSAFREENLPPANGAGVARRDGGRRGDALLLSWDFLVPDDTDWSDTQLLERIIAKLENDREFAEHRLVFNDLRRRLVAGGVDPAAAKAEIARRLEGYNGILKTIARLQRVRSVMTYAAIAAPLVDFVVPNLGTVGGVGLGLASQAWPHWAPNPRPSEDELTVAMVHDLREAFGRRR